MHFPSATDDASAEADNIPPARSPSTRGVGTRTADSRETLADGRACRHPPRDPHFGGLILLSSRILAVAAVAAPLLVPLQANALDDARRAEIESVVRSYLLEHPEVIIEAVDAMRAKNEATAAEKTKNAVVANRESLRNDPDSPTMGNTNGDVVLVEFFDYNCGYCKSVQKDLMDIVKNDGKIKFVFKDFPILAESSMTAAKAALAARRQGKYVDLHVALMGKRGTLDTDSIMQLAGSVGLDTAKLKADMESPEIAKIIEKNKELAEEIGVGGTPAFALNDRFVGGAVPKTELLKMIAREREK